MKYFATFIVFLSSLWQVGFAQELRLGYFQTDHQYLVNPANVVNDESKIFLEYGQRWSDLQSPPEVFQLGGVFQSTDRLSFGGIINRQTSGTLDLYHIGVSTGYKVNISENQSLSAGLDIYLKSNSINLNGIIADLSDPVLNGDGYENTVVGVGLGLSYQYDKVKIHFAIPETHDPDYLLSYMTAGLSYDLERIKDFNILPVITYFRNPVDDVVEGLVMATWRESLTVGAGYRSNNSFGMRLQLHSGSISIGYALGSNSGSFMGKGISNNFSVAYVFGKENPDFKNIFRSKQR